MAFIYTSPLTICLRARTERWESAGESVCRPVVGINVRSSEVNVPRGTEMMRKSWPRSSLLIQESKKKKTKDQFQKKSNWWWLRANLMSTGRITANGKILLTTCTFYTAYDHFHPHKKKKKERGPSSKIVALFGSKAAALLPCREQSVTFPQCRTRDELASLVTMGCARLQAQRDGLRLLLQSARAARQCLMTQHWNISAVCSPGPLLL